MAHNQRRNHLALCTVGSLLMGCGGPYVDPADKEYARLSFQNYSQYFDTLDLVGKMSDLEVIKWESDNKFYSFYTFAKERNQMNDSPKEISKATSILLNPSMEFVIGKNIIWFKDGYQFTIADGDEAKLRALKDNPNTWRLLSHVIRSQYSKESVSNERYVLDEVDSSPNINNFAGKAEETTFEFGSGKGKHEFIIRKAGYCDEKNDGWGTVSMFKTAVTLRYCYKRYSWSPCSWQPAGEIFRKEITGLTLSGSSPYIGAVNVGPFDYRQIDNGDLEQTVYEAFGSCWMHAFTMKGQYDLQLDGTSDPYYGWHGVKEWR